MDAPVAIRTEGLSKTFGSTKALVSLDLEVAPGEVLGYLGPNGAGKTTTIRLLLGLIRASAGRGFIFGVDAQADPVEAHRRLAYVPGDVSLWPQLTGGETLHLLGRVNGSVDATYRDTLIERFELDPSKKVRSYSKGNRQKVVLIAALMTRADLLLLDEPTSGLDPLMERIFREVVAEARGRGQTIFLSSHILSEVEALCDRVAILRAGQLVETGTLAELRHLSAVHVEADIVGVVPDVASVDGVSNVSVVGERLTCRVTGSVEPLLEVLVRAKVSHLLITEPSLEELFLAHYGAVDAAYTTVGTLVGRRASYGAMWWGLGLGSVEAATALSYKSAFPTALSRASLAASINGNAGFAALFGPVFHLDTVAGYTAYKSLSLMVIVIAIWGLFLGTRTQRAEEDAGRWELLLSGPTTRGDAALQALGGVGAALMTLWVCVAVCAAPTGLLSSVSIGVGASLYLAVAVTASAAMFAVVGLVAGQLASTRHDANVIGAGVLAAAYLVRMVADSTPSLAWLRWASPLGWIEDMRALTGSHVLPIVPVVVFVAVLGGLSVWIAARRDLGASVLAAHDAPRARTLLLGGQAGLTVRLTRTTVLVWLAVLATCGVVFGLVAEAAGTAFKGSPGIQRAIDRLGGRASGAVAYLGLVFLIAAALVAIAVAGQVSALRNEEADGHLDNLLVLPVQRWQWLGTRLVVGVALVVGASALAGVGAWLGAASQHTGVGFGSLLKSGLNVAPPAVFVLGIGALVYGVWPRMAVPATYALVVWSFVVEVIAAVFNSNHWFRDLSPVLHITPAPAVGPDWTAAVWLVGLGVIAAGVGAAAFGRRDLVGA